MLNHISKSQNLLVDWRNKYIKERPFIIILSVLIGIVSGLIAAFIKLAVYWTESLLTNFFKPYAPNFLYVLYPIVGVIITLLIIKLVVRQPVNPGIPNILYAISKRSANIKTHNLFSSIFTSAFTVGFGGSVGLEGPTVATSSAWGSNFGRFFRVDYKTKILLIGAGVTGSMAAIFQAPIAAIIFAIEVIMIDLTTVSLIPLLFSSIAAFLSSNYFMGEAILIDYAITDRDYFSDIPFLIVLGILLGLFSVWYSRVFFALAAFFDRLTTVQKLALGGTLLGILIFVLPPLYGEGYDTINNLINGHLEDVFDNSYFYPYKDSFWVVFGFLAALFVFKVIATSLTINIGGVGGIFAPTLFIGATGGFLFGHLINRTGLAEVSEGNFTLVGMAGMLSGVLYAPLTAIFLIAEITEGYALFVPLMITSVVSFVTYGFFTQHSIYTRQLAQRGELMTHHADENVLQLMNLRKEIENDFSIVYPTHSLRQLVDKIAASKRNVFPVVDQNNTLKGVVYLDNVRPLMFKHELYDTTQVSELMVSPPATIQINERMDAVMDRFEKSGAWNLPVLDGNKYLGFVSKSKLFTDYRNVLREFSDH
jgi:CIC family chloride channel protein